ncbi:MAG: glycerophosphodiester phosphodiesterase [Bacteroidaceae bacterium]|nr:glycerophosphodiester phosphodiesterase [Bacteroidaceae bacterium]
MNKELCILAISAILATASYGQHTASIHNQTTQVIAHRGYWNKNGSAQNSIASLQYAQEIGIYGSEFDVHMTADKELIVFHELHIDTIQDVRQAPYESIQNHLLTNGEHIPLLSEYLDYGAANTNIKLILEIKSHLTPKLETEMVSKILAMVDERSLHDRVEYIAFSLHICRELVRLNPTASVAYLSGDISPTQALEYGLTGIDYHYSKYTNNPGWIKEAREKGVTVNVWTVNNENDILNMLNQGVDFITTDYPEVIQQLIKKRESIKQ